MAEHTDRFMTKLLTRPEASEHNLASGYDIYAGSEVEAVLAGLHLKYISAAGNVGYCAASGSRGCHYYTTGSRGDCHVSFGFGSGDSPFAPLRFEPCDGVVEPVLDVFGFLEFVLIAILGPAAVVGCGCGRDFIGEGVDIAVEVGCCLLYTLTLPTICSV